MRVFNGTNSEHDVMNSKRKRKYDEMKKIVFYINMLLTVSLCLHNTFAQDGTQLALPEGAKVRLGKGSIDRVAYSPDGTKLAVVVHAGSYINIWVYDTQTYQEISLLTVEDDNYVMSMAFSPDGTIFASRSEHNIYFWDVTTGELLGDVHSYGYEKILFSPDGTTLIVESGDFEYYDVTTGELLRSIDVRRGLFSPDGTILASRSEDDNVSLWDVTIGELLHTIEGENDRWLSYIAFSPDGRMLAVSGYREDSEIRVLDVVTGELLTIEGSKWHRNWNPENRFVLFSPDGNMLASECEDDMLRLWNTRTGETLLTIEDKRSYRSSVVAFSPDGTKFVVTDWDGDTDVRVWNVATREHLTLEYDQWGAAEATDVLFSPDSTTLAVESEDDFRLWNVRTGETLLTIEGYGLYRGPTLLNLTSADEYFSGLDEALRDFLPRSFGYVLFSPDGTIFADVSMFQNATINLRDSTTGKTISTLKGYNSTIHGRFVSFSPDGNTLVSFGSTNFHNHYLFQNIICLWSVTTGELLRTIEGFGLFSPDGNTLVSFGSEGIGLQNSTKHTSTIRFWDVTTGEHRHTIEGHIGIGNISFSPDGSLIASVGGGGDCNVYLWNTRTGQLLHKLEGHTKGVYSVAFSPDGKILASGSSDNTVRLWRPTGEHIRTIEHDGSHWFGGMAFSPDGTMLAAPTKNEINLWRPTGEHIRTIEGENDNSIGEIAFSPDGTTLTGASHREINLWNVTTGEHIRTIEGENDNSISEIAFSPDGTMLASGGLVSHNTFSSKNTFRLWSPTTGQLFHTLEERWNSSLGSGDVAFSPDGILLAGASGGEISLWDAATGKETHAYPIELGKTSYVVNVLFSPDGTTLASVGGEGVILLWDTSNIAGYKPRRVNFQKNNEMSLSPSCVLSPDIGDQLTFDLNIAGGQNIIGYQATVLFDATALRYVSSHQNRQPAAYYIYRSSPYSWSVENTITFKAYSIEGIAATETIGNGTLATITFEVVDQKQSTVHLLGVLLDDSSGESSIPKSENAVITIDDHGDTQADPTLLSSGGCLVGEIQIVGDVNGDGFVNLLDLQVIDSRMGMTGEDTSDEKGDADVNGDGIVNIADIVLVNKFIGDVNGDSVVNFKDLELVGERLGETGENTADINADGIVNIADLVMVAANAFFHTEAAAPDIYKQAVARLTCKQVQQWLIEAKLLKATSTIYQRGIFALEQLLTILTPKQTSLLPNYPNPFNPETWIPYQLAQPAAVRISIYAADGTLVRTLDLGHQPMGMYKNRNRAAHWDGRNTLGESVASGIYFYELTVGDFSATRKMLIRK